MSAKRRLKNKKPPEGWELIEEVIEDFEAQVQKFTATVVFFGHSITNASRANAYSGLLSDERRCQ